ncbi:MAG: threonine-phosphate decarboxylase [Firmicutes bacterium]|nr:threonine-phosphate decarboxylase [Bacillota bacterium]
MNKHGGYYGNKKNILDFSVNINPLKTPEKTIENIKKYATKLHKYPEIEGKTGKKIIANNLGIDTKKVILGNGAIELIYLFARAFKPKKVLIIQPTFNEYERAFKLVNSEIFHFQRDEKSGFNIDVEKLSNYIDKVKPDTVILCNPNNPTATYTEKEKFKRVLEKIKNNNSYLFLDESFIDFSNKESFIELTQKYPIFIIRSMTKYFAVPGIRLGFGIGNKKIINSLNKYKEPWTINTIALNTISELLNDDSYIKKTKEWYLKEKEYMNEKLKEIKNINYYKSNTNFYLCKTDITSKKLKDKLINKNINIRTCEDFYGLENNHFRICIKNRLENEYLINQLNLILN